MEPGSRCARPSPSSESPWTLLCFTMDSRTMLRDAIFRCPKPSAARMRLPHLKAAGRAGLQQTVGIITDRKRDSGGKRRQFLWEERLYAAYGEPVRERTGRAAWDGSGEKQGSPSRD